MITEWGNALSKRVTLSFHVVALIVLAAVMAVLAIGGRVDPAGPAVAMDGAWRFHPGDNAKWADPKMDARDWDQLNLVSRASIRDNDVGLPGWLAGWNAHGHPKLEGYGWYRRDVTLPARGDVVLLGPTMVDDGYEMFWNGRPIGGIGKLGPGPKVIGARPYLVGLPNSDGQRSGVLAIRTYMQPGLDRDNVSGGLRSVPMLATAAFGERLHRAQWMRTIAGYIVEVALPLLMVVLAGIALFVARATPRPSFARWLAIALAATACLRLGNAISAWTDLLDVSTLIPVNAILLSPFAMIAWTAAWNEWTDGRGRRAVLIITVAAWAARVYGGVADASTVISIARIVFIALFAIVAARIARHGVRRPLAFAAMIMIAVALFINELSKFGVPSIWFPFNIGVTLTQYCYALELLILPFVLTSNATGAPEPLDSRGSKFGNGGLSLANHA